MDFDLDLIVKKAHTIKLGGEVYEFKDLSVEESLIAEYEAKEIENYTIISKEDAKGLQKRIGKYLASVVEIPETVAAKVTLKQFKGIRKIMGRMDLYDQGFNDAEIDRMEKEAMKKTLFQTNKEE